MTSDFFAENWIERGNSSSCKERKTIKPCEWNVNTWVPLAGSLNYLNGLYVAVTVHRTRVHFATLYSTPPAIGQSIGNLLLRLPCPPPPQLPSVNKAEHPSNFPSPHLAHVFWDRRINSSSSLPVTGVAGPSFDIEDIQSRAAVCALSDNYVKVIIKRR